MSRLSGILLICFCCVAAVCAQNNNYKKTEFFVGYSSNIVADDEFRVVGRGVNVSGVYNFKRRFGIKADVSLAFDKGDTYQFAPGFNNPTNASVSYKRRDSIYNYVAGIQFKNTSIDKKAKPFLHAMAGVGQNKVTVTNISCTTANTCAAIPLSETNTGLSVIVGGGLDLKINDKIDVRLFQLDVNSISYQRSPSSREGSASFRFSAGIVFK